MAGAPAVSPLRLASAASDPLKEKQQQVKQHLNQAHDALEESSARARRTATRLAEARDRLASARGALAAAQARVEAARVRDQQMQARLQEAVQRLASARDELSNGRVAVGDQRDNVAGMIQSIYQQGDPELLAFSALLNAQTTADLTLQAEARDAMVGQETNAYDELRAAEVLLQVREDQVQQAKQDTADRRREAAEHLVAMREAEQAAADAEAAVESSVAQSRSARSAALAARTADMRQLRQLKQEQQHIEELLRARARNHQRSPTAPSGGFLSYPSTGPVTSPFGYRIHPIYGYYGLHDGVDFGTGCGTALYAAADGTVLSSYWSSVYGNRLVLDHGTVKGVGLATIYNHATRYTVGTGARVSRGQVIGYSGSTGWSTGCHLHFTVMVNGTAVDPMNWL